jgi:hypothetical protein
VAKRNTVLLPVDKVELSIQENFISFDFVALNYEAPEKIQYAYRMEGAIKTFRI